MIVLMFKSVDKSKYFFFFQAEDGIRDYKVTGVQTCALPISNEIRAAESVPTDKIEVKEQEKKLARQLIESLAAPFEPQKYRDEYQENVRAMIAAKLKGQEVTEVAQPHM